METDYFRELYAKFTGMTYEEAAQLPLSMLLELERHGTLNRAALLERMRGSWRWLVKSVLSNDSSTADSWALLQQMQREIREHDGADRKGAFSVVRLAEHGLKTLSKSDALHMGYFGTVSYNGKSVSTQRVGSVLILCTVPQNLLLTDEIAYGFNPAKAAAGVQLAWKLWHDLELYVAQQFDGLQEVPALVRAN